MKTNDIWDYILHVIQILEKYLFTATNIYILKFIQCVQILLNVILNYEN